MSDVSLRNINKQFGPVQALDDVSIEIASGELIALLGPSGCGKTTLLRCVAGLEHPDSGVIAVAGVDMTAVPTRKRPIGMVFQNYALFPNMTIRDNIGFPLKVRGVDKSERRDRVDELLEMVRLVAQADRYPHQVSGGQQQRAALGRALSPSPEVLLLDEPLSALDAQVRNRLRDEIRRIQQQVKTTAIYVTHDQSEAMAIADRVAVMNQGRIDQLAPPNEIYDVPASRFSASFVGNRNMLELTGRDGWVSLGKAFTVEQPAGSDRSMVFFRPEDIEISLVGDGQPAEIESKLFLGSSTRVYLLVNSAAEILRIFADIPSRSALGLEIGQSVVVRIDPGDVRVFPAED